MIDQLSTREAYRRLLANNRQGPEVFREAGFGFFHPVRRLGRRTVARAWIGTYWPRLAEWISVYNLWRARRLVCGDHGCERMRGHYGGCLGACIYCGNPPLCEDVSQWRNTFDGTICQSCDRTGRSYLYGVKPYAGGRYE